MVSSLRRKYLGKLGAAILLALASLSFFIVDEPVIGVGFVAASLLLAVKVDRQLLKDLSLIALGLLIMALIPINTDISYEHMAVMGTAMTVIVASTYLISRYVYKDYSIHFPWHIKARWTRQQWTYLGFVLVIGYLVMPFYMIQSGVYENWPAARSSDEILRLFIGTNALGIWDELFFICTVFVLLRKHFGLWVANILQAVFFTAFLYELGFEGWGPAMIYLFALVQGYIFTKTQSLFYIVTVHLLFDLILFLVLLHAHSREMFQIFLY